MDRASLVGLIFVVFLGSCSRTPEQTTVSEITAGEEVRRAAVPEPLPPGDEGAASSVAIALI